jgi:hypothetical protein
MPMWQHALTRMLTAVTLFNAALAVTVMVVASPPDDTRAPCHITRELPVPLPPADPANVPEFVGYRSVSAHGTMSGNDEPFFGGGAILMVRWCAIKQ